MIVAGLTALQAHVDHEDAVALVKIQRGDGGVGIRVGVERFRGQPFVVVERLDEANTRQLGACGWFGGTSWSAANPRPASACDTSQRLARGSTLHARWAMLHTVVKRCWAAHGAAPPLASRNLQDFCSGIACRMKSRATFSIPGEHIT